MQSVSGELPPPMSVEEMAAAPERFSVKTHEMPGADSWPAMYLVRDGRDVLVSYAHYALKTQRGIEPGSDRELFLSTLRNMITSPRRFGSWGTHALAWSRRTEPTSIVRFEELIRRPAETLRKALLEMGVQPCTESPSEAPSFEELHASLPWFFRRGKTGAWQDEMPEELQALFWQHHGEAMEAFGYGRGEGPKPDSRDRSGEAELAGAEWGRRFRRFHW